MKDFPGDARTVGADLNAALRPRHEEPLPWAPLAASSYPSLTRRECAAPFPGHALCIIKKIYFPRITVRKNYNSCNHNWTLSVKRREADLATIRNQKTHQDMGLSQSKPEKSRKTWTSWSPPMASCHDLRSREEVVTLHFSLMAILPLQKSLCCFLARNKPVFHDPHPRRS